MEHPTEDKMEIVYATEVFPESCAKSIFLAGPTPKSKKVKSWRPQAIKILQKFGYDGTVFVPEPRDGRWAWPFQWQIDWENKGLNRASCILFWIPRHLKTLPGFTTNIEFGEWHKSGKIVLGAPEKASKMRYLFYKAKQHKVPRANTLGRTVRLAIKMVNK